MLGDEPYSTMCSMAGKVAFVGGGPQLQNVEHSQMVPQTGRPAAGEGQGGADPVGLGGPGGPGKGGHGLPRTRRWTQWSAARSRAQQGAYIQWANALHHSLIKFDECRLGQVVMKSTTLSMDLPLHRWHDLRCNHGAQSRGEKLNSSDLSLMQGLAAAILCTGGSRWPHWGKNGG